MDMKSFKNLKISNYHRTEMNIEKILSDRNAPDRLAKNLKELYERESTPGTKEYRDFQNLYNPERKKRNPCE